MKRFLLIALAIVMVTIFAACGKEKPKFEEIELPETTTEAPSFFVPQTTKTDEALTNTITDENNAAFVKRYEKYDLSKIGITKPISNYRFQLTGESITASDGEKVYILYLLENGTYTNYIFGFTPEKDYYYDPALDQYIPLEEALAR